MPVIEAFLLNSNTLFSHCTAMAEFNFAPNNTFDPTDGAAITAKIDAALRARSTPHPEWHEQRQYVVEKYNWRKSAKLLAKLYHADAAMTSSAL